jgi:hypothetical protein
MAGPLRLLMASMLGIFKKEVYENEDQFVWYACEFGLMLHSNDILFSSLKFRRN